MMASRLMLLVVVFALGLHSVVGAPVSVAMGIDLGTDNSVVALARKRGVDIIANEASQRSTPSIVSFGHDQRHVGEAGFSQRMMNVKNTVAEPKRLLGKLFSNQAFMDELKSEAYQVVEGEGGEIAVKVSLCGTERAFRPVQIISMLLANLRKIAETDHGAEVVDVAISVPLFFTEHQRRAILVAAEIAGLKCLRLINDNTATALAYGITKTDLPDKDARHVAFVDCGRDCMQVSVVAFTKGQLKVLSHTYTKKVCGRRIDGILFEHFASEFNDKYKIDARTQDRARLRLLVQCEKLKKTLSACPEDLETPINVECLMNDMDVCGMMNRIKLEELLNNEQVFGDIDATCEQALARAGLGKEQVDSVELVGGTSRIPALRAHIGKFFDKECQTTINAAESVARGASLACAMDSPAFKVREFKVLDLSQYPVDVAYKSEDGSAQGVLSLKAGSQVPGGESVKLQVGSPVTFDCKYADDAEIEPHVPRDLASHLLKVGAAKEGQKQTVVAKIGYDNSGCIAAETVLETQWEEAVPPPAAPKKADQAGAPAEGDGGGEGEAEKERDGDAAMGEGKEGGKKEDAGKGGEGKKRKEDKNKGDKGDKGKADVAPEMKLVTRREKVDAQVVVRAGYASQVVSAFAKEELDMALQDRLVQETNDARNRLEEYVYKMRDALSNNLAPFEADDKRAAFAKQLDQIEEWLYGDGEGASKSVFIEKLEGLQAVGEPISMRAREFEMIPEAFNRLERTVQATLARVQTKDAKFDHISPDERATVTDECARTGEWIQQQKDAVAAASKLNLPPLSVEALSEKERELHKMCDRVMNKAKPPPPTPPTPPKDDKAQGGAPGADQGGEGGEDGAGGDVPMDGDKGKGEGENPMHEGEGAGEEAPEPVTMDQMD